MVTTAAGAAHCGAGDRGRGGERGAAFWTRTALAGWQWAFVIGWGNVGTRGDGQCGRGRAVHGASVAGRSTRPVGRWGLHVGTFCRSRSLLPPLPSRRRFRTPRRRVLHGRIRPLTEEAVVDALPSLATAEQLAHYWGTRDQVMGRVGLSLAGVMFTSLLSGVLLKGAVAALAGTLCFFYWLLEPAFRASQRNLTLRRFPYAGLFCGTVREVFVSETVLQRVRTGDGGRRRDAPGGVLREVVQRRINVVASDPSGRRITISGPLLPEQHRGLAPGQQVSLIVVSDVPDFRRVGAVSDACVRIETPLEVEPLPDAPQPEAWPDEVDEPPLDDPERLVWIGDYPFVNKAFFAELMDAAWGRVVPVRAKRSRGGYDDDDGDDEEEEEEEEEREDFIVRKPKKASPKRNRRRGRVSRDDDDDDQFPWDVDDAGNGLGRSDDPSTDELEWLVEEEEEGVEPWRHRRGPSTGKRKIYPAIKRVPGGGQRPRRPPPRENEGGEEHGGDEPDRGRGSPNAAAARDATRTHTSGTVVRETPPGPPWV